MFGFLGFILILLLVIVLLAFSLLGNLLRFVFGLGRSTPKQYNNTYSYSEKNTQETGTTSVSQEKTEKKKIFNKDDGEYVEFEEIQ